MSGQNGQVGGAPRSAAPRGSTAVAALSGLLAVVLLSAVGVVALRDSDAEADTVLVSGADAVVVSPDGTRSPAREGQQVPPGATVLAGTTGAVLATREREVHLGQATSITVLDGVRQRLDSGFVMVDATDAPGLELTTGAGVVTAADDSLVRVVAGPLVRVGVLRGDTASVRAAGRRASTEVATYYQAQVAAGGLPTEATPLLLTGDTYERDLAAELYAADRDLNALARRLDMDGDAGPAVLRVLSTVAPDVAVVPGAAESERALSFLLAAAADPEQVGASFQRVRALRTGGGSWGVVAAIVGVGADEVGGVLGALLAPETPSLAAGPGEVTAPAVLTPADLVDLLAPLAPSAPGDPDAPTAPAGPAPTSGPRPTPSEPAPTPPPADPSPPVPATGVPVVDDVVEVLLDLLAPSPGAAPSLAPVPAPAPASPAPLLDLDLSLLD